MRTASVREKEEDAWDNWLAGSIGKLPSGLMKLVKQEGLGYLKRSNNDLFKPEGDKLNSLDEELNIDELD